MKRSGFTLIELLIVLTIIAVLVLISVPFSKSMKKKMETARCVTNMKRIYHALDSHVKDHGYWPQQPMAFTREEEIWEWWYAALDPYQIGKEHWLCPTDDRERGDSSERDEYEGSYAPTTFDGRRLTPYRWNMPWLIERGDYHTKGQHLVMPDGSVLVAPELLQSQGGGGLGG